MKRIKLLLTSLIGLALSVGLLPVGMASADGDEELNSIAGVASGTGVAMAGVGLYGGDGVLTPGDITVDVPIGASVEQVLLYWQGREDENVTPDATTTLMVNGNPVTGSIIGGPLDPFGGPGVPVAYREDITSLGAVSDGSSTLSISGDPFVGFLNSGAGVIVVYDEGFSAGIVDVRDGLDSAWAPAGIPVEQVTVPQTFSFDTANFSRLATLTVMASEIGDSENPARFRESTVRVTDGGVADFDNVMQFSDGPLWDTLTLPINVVAGIDSITIELISGNDEPVPPGFSSSDPASLFWVTSALHFPPGGKGRMTGGGQNLRFADDVRITKGLTIHCDLRLSNNLNVVWPGDSGSQNHFRMTEHTFADCVDTEIDQRPPDAPFDTFIGEGTGKLNGASGASISWVFVDAGEPGTSDQAGMEIKDGDGKTVLLLPLETVANGNLQAHFDQPHKGSRKR
jgi:hypothetical protein